MNFIKKIFDKKVDESVHLQFQKFSRGEFRNRALIEAKNSSGKFTIKTSPEFGNEIIRIGAEKLGDSKTIVNGAIISTNNLKENPEFSELLAHAEVKQFQGVKRFIINKEMNGKEILNFLEKNPKAFFGLSFKTEDFEVKIKDKAPKSGKPGKGDAAPKADFCKLVIKDKEVADSFVFEKSNWKKVFIKHSFFIDKIVIPDELKESKDFALIREQSRRKGKIVREAEIDEESIKNEVEFEA